MKLIDVSMLKEWVKNWFTKNQFYHPYAKNNNIPITELYDILERLPSAQHTGRWIEDGYSHYEAVCDQCGEPCATYVMNHPRDRFCKWCGADMRQMENGNV